jgi:hypothetical protein
MLLFRTSKVAKTSIVFGSPGLFDSLSRRLLHIFHCHETTITEKSTKNDTRKSPSMPDLNRIGAFGIRDVRFDAKTRVMIKRKGRRREGY